LIEIGEEFLDEFVGDGGSDKDDFSICATSFI
jgi:hypothetical protein